MHRLFTLCICALFLGCVPSAESVVNAAIQAANQDDLNAFIETLDNDSADVVERVRQAGDTLPPDWVWMEGTPWRLLTGASITAKDEVSDNAVRFSLSCPSSDITELWVLKSDDGPLPSWRIHLMGSKGLITPLRLVKR